ncbi:hypothetical protein D1Y78_09625 [Riemerella anatipestifer]|nr:hypothetical protein [Riemerella anatipestifer]
MHHKISRLKTTIQSNILKFNIMKKIIFVISLLPFVAKAQTGKVGINTEKPTETLQVEGTLRVTDLPANGASNAIYNGGNSKNTGFNATKTVVVDANGVLGTVDGLPEKSQSVDTNPNISTPTEKCLRGIIGERGYESAEPLTFTTSTIAGMNQAFNYTFTFKDGGSGFADLLIRQDGAGDMITLDAKNQQIGGNWNAPWVGDFQIRPNEDTRIVGLRIDNSQYTSGVIIIGAPGRAYAEGGLTFDYRVAMINKIMANGQWRKFYNFCIKMSDY